MANFEILNFTQTWILSKYSKFISSNKNQSDWKTLDSSGFGTPLILSLTPTNFLVVKHENEIQEFINLWSAKNNMKGLYKGNSLLIMHKMKDLMRKFRVQFLSSKTKSAEENCFSCVKELSRFIEIIDYDTNKNFNTQFEGSKQSLESTSCNISNYDDTITLEKMTKILLRKNEHKLPLMYQSENELINDNEDKSMQEFIVCCLLDPKFSSFVKKVESLLNDIVKDDLKN